VGPKAARPSWPLGVQFFVVLSLATCFLVVLIGELAARRDLSYLRAQTERQYELLLDHLKVTATDAIAAEDISLLTQLVSKLGKSDKSLHTLKIVNAEGRVLVRWHRPLTDGAKTFALKPRTVAVDGKPQGSLHAVVDLSAALVEVGARVQNTRLAMAALLLLLALTVGAMVYRLAVVPLATLDTRLSRFRKGQLDDDLKLDAASEFQRVAEALNAFARQVRERREIDAAHRNELHELNDSYARFVPRQFLDFLDHESIVAVKHGDQIERTMTVMFSDIRSFTGISQRIGAHDTFAFINDFLGRLGPAIRRHNGFIDKYIGDAVMALFDSPMDAVRAGIEMLQTLEQLNNERATAKLDPIRIGIGLNTGPLMLGIIGEDLRMEGTVIGDAVNLAARLESLTKKYHVPLLISEDTLNAIHELREGRPSADLKDNIRFVDAVVAKGRSTKTRVYEVFAADDEPLRSVKRRHEATFFRVLGNELSSEAFTQSDTQDPLLPTYRRIASRGSIRESVVPETPADTEEEVYWS
jgi:class 3 adenylate cyclase